MGDFAKYSDRQIRRMAGKDEPDQGWSRFELKLVVDKQGYKIRRGPYRGCAFVYVEEPIPTRSNGYRAMWYNVKTHKLEKLPADIDNLYSMWAVNYGMYRTMSWKEFLRRTLG